MYGGEPLRCLIKYSQQEVIQLLQQASEKELWEAFLPGQAELFFDMEKRYIEKSLWWGECKEILEIGSGNGNFLGNLAKQYPEKSFAGIEKLEESVILAKASFPELTFYVGDAEVFDPRREHSVDVVIFRFTLQHLKHPKEALHHAWKYVRPRGYVLIIDAYDLAKKTSHPIPIMDHALDRVRVAQQQGKAGGNRKITLECMSEEGFEVVFSNLDNIGEVIHQSVRLEGERDRKRLFNHVLLFLALIERKYSIEMDWEAAYRQAKEYLEDEAAWTSLGIHFLVLRKN